MINLPDKANEEEIYIDDNKEKEKNKKELLRGIVKQSQNIDRVKTLLKDTVIKKQKCKAMKHKVKRKQKAARIKHSGRVCKCMENMVNDQEENKRKYEEHIAQKTVDNEIDEDYESKQNIQKQFKPGKKETNGPRFSNFSNLLDKRRKMKAWGIQIVTVKNIPIPRFTVIA